MLFLEGDYIYSPLTNMIVKVPEVVRDILHYRIQGKSDDDIIKELTSSYPVEKIKLALKEIDEYNRKIGLFSLKRPYFKRAAFPHSPTEIREHLENKLSHMILDITWDCNLACKYCKFSGIYEGERVNTGVYMDKKIIEKALLFFKSHSGLSERVSLGFYGGEPLLAFDNIRYAVNLAENLFRDKPIRFSLTTNGTLLANGKIRRFLKEHNFSLNVSIDGPQSIHDRYRVTRAQKPTFQLIKRNLCKFKEEFPDYFERKVGYIITLAPPFDLKSISRFINLWECKTHAPVFVSLVDPYDTDFYKNFTKEEIEEFDRQIEELVNKTLKEDIPDGIVDDFLYQFLYKDLFIYHNSPKGRLSEEFLIGGFCIPGHDRTFIAPDGSIYPCEKVHYHLKIGDIFNGFNFDRINEIVQEVESLRNKNCLDCPIARLCNICYAHIYRNEKLREDLFRRTCKSKMKYWEKLLGVYAKVKEINPGFFDLSYIAGKGGRQDG